MVKEQEEMSTKQRFERLQKLLGKSKFYTDFLLQKMQVGFILDFHCLITYDFRAMRLLWI